MSDARLGIKSKMYLNTAAPGPSKYGTPTWTEVSIVDGINVTGTWNFATAQTRQTAFERGARTTLPISVSGNMQVPKTASSPGYSSFVAFDNAFFNSNAVLDIMILNGAKDENASTGYRCEWELLNWSEDQSSGNVLFKTFELKPSLCTNPPKRVVVTGEEPAFTDAT